MDWRIYLYKYMKHIYDMRQYNINKINTYKKVTSNPTKKTDTCPHNTCDKPGATSVSSNPQLLNVIPNRSWSRKYTQLREDLRDKQFTVMEISYKEATV